MDSCKINGNISFPARHMALVSLINEFSKYNKINLNSDELINIDGRSNYRVYECLRKK